MQPSGRTFREHCRSIQQYIGPENPLRMLPETSLRWRLSMSLIAAPFFLIARGNVFLGVAVGIAAIAAVPFLVLVSLIFDVLFECPRILFRFLVRCGDLLTDLIFP
jgi:hypothetical protein